MPDSSSALSSRLGSGISISDFVVVLIYLPDTVQLKIEECKGNKRSRTCQLAAGDQVIPQGDLFGGVGNNKTQVSGKGRNEARWTLGLGAAERWA